MEHRCWEGKHRMLFRRDWRWMKRAALLWSDLQRFVRPRKAKGKFHKAPDVNCSNNRPNNQNCPSVGDAASQTCAARPCARWVGKFKTQATCKRPSSSMSHWTQTKHRPVIQGEQPRASTQRPPCVNENRGQGPGEKGLTQECSHRHSGRVAGPMAGSYLTPPSYCIITVIKTQKIGSQVF